MRKTTFLALVCLLQVSNSFAQYYTKANSKWFFGFNAGLDFSSGSPVSFYSNNMYSDEGAAGVCDIYGNTLFYTDGRNAINRLGDVMNNGYGMPPFNSYGSCTNAAQIVQNLGNLNQYYVFSLQEDTRLVNPSDPYSGRLCYSIVDMSLDSGRGAVLDSVKGVMLDSVLSEKMIAIPGNNCNVWLVNHSRDYARFYVREITASGVGLPTVYTAGANNTYGFYAQGTMIFSPDRTKIAMVSFQYMSRDQALELFSFDPNTGRISNEQMIENLNRGYGCEFSPNSKLLYTLDIVDDNMKVMQYDCSLTTTAAIQASKNIVFTDSPRFAIYSMKLAPDNKIYLLSMSSDSLDCITAPNNVATLCGYSKNLVGLFAGTHGVYGLPNVYVTADTSCSIIKRLNTPVCLSPNLFSVYPNPASGTLTITTPTPTGAVALTDITGRQAITKKVTEATTTIEIGALSKGVYFAAWTDENGAKAVQKIVVE